ncbi:MAG TPA: YggS family pyridoxal phosphate-dependent enzyme [Bacteroidota bacterium]|nr:YggS family pyridoxal phosphate-dependent enzyme [Bacteroidota bacterium]
MFKPRMIAENVKNLKERIANACLAASRTPDSVSLLAVTKTFGEGKIRDAIGAGIFDFGENYVQELTAKREKLRDEKIRWHFIGHLQSNKVKYIADWITMIHSVDNDGVASEIEKHGSRLGRTIKVLVEVNTSAEATKFGVRPAEAGGLLRRIAGHPHLEIQGLMTVGPFTDDADESRRSFRLLKKIFDEVNSAGILPRAMTHLSMGMSHDFPTAIAEGATIIRIGTAIFGARAASHVN